MYYSILCNAVLFEECESSIRKNRDMNLLINI